ncbi:unnamed protein product [Ilex paraguariensis]|uniref:FRIGIDA-like protein n=1 Tax=Ilex paraguariensis TaxID=185542 RepID=A0ABC8T815_9AQUA
MANPTVATNSTHPSPIPPSVKAENDPPPSQYQSGTPDVKQENTHNPTPPTRPPQQSSPPPPQPPCFINSITELRHLSTALSAFQRRYEELQQHFDFIRTSIDSKLPQDLIISPPPPQKLANVTAIETSSQTFVPESAIVEPKTTPPPPQELTITPVIETLSKTLVPESGNLEQKTDNDKSPKTELERLCQIMCSRDIRKYVATHLSDINKLREEIPRALKFAKSPAKLVLECFGRFFLQGTKAYTKDSPMIPAREASVLILECFLLMDRDGVEIDGAVKGEAELASVAWRKRLISEGGLGKACEIDARGLLLLVGCFGIPHEFKNEDIRDLIRTGNVKEICGALRRSTVLMARIRGNVVDIVLLVIPINHNQYVVDSFVDHVPNIYKGAREGPDILGRKSSTHEETKGIIEGMIKHKMEIEAVDIAYTFGVYESFSPKTILTSFLRESKETWKRATKATESSIAAVNKANKKQLADLKAVIKCLRDHNIDHSKLLPGWQINDRISSLEKEIADLDKKTEVKVMPKRKVDEMESSKWLKTQEIKRSRVADHVPQQHRAAGHVESRSPYDRLTPMNLLDGGLPVNISYSDSPYVLHGSGAVLLPEYTAGSITGRGSGVFAPGFEAGISAGTGGDLPTGSYAGARQMMNPNGQPYGWRGDATFDERLVAHNFAGQAPAVGLTSLYRQSSSFEGFVGLPNASSVGVSNRSSASDLYQFADSVLDSDLYRGSGSRTVSTVPRVVPAHRSSYLY